MKEKIFIDVDEVCAETVGYIYPKVNIIFGTNFTYETTKDYKDVFGSLISENGKPITNERKIEIFNKTVLEDRGNNLIRAVEGSIEGIIRLSDGFDISMLTARHKMLSEYTPEWTKHHYNGCVGKVLFAGDYHGEKRKKSEICLEEGARIMIEDDMDYALEIAEKGILVFLLRTPWNEHRKETHKNIKRIDTWHDLKI